jgi:hypothetical protein
MKKTLNEYTKLSKMRKFLTPLNRSTKFLPVRRYAPESPRLVQSHAPTHTKKVDSISAHDNGGFRRVRDSEWSFARMNEECLPD